MFPNSCSTCGSSCSSLRRSGGHGWGPSLRVPLSLAPSTWASSVYSGGRRASMRRLALFPRERGKAWKPHERYRKEPHRQRYTLYFCSSERAVNRRIDCGAALVEGENEVSCASSRHIWAQRRCRSIQSLSHSTTGRPTPVGWGSRTIALSSSSEALKSRSAAYRLRDDSVDAFRSTGCRWSATRFAETLDKGVGGSRSLVIHTPHAGAMHQWSRALYTKQKALWAPSLSRKPRRHPVKRDFAITYLPHAWARSPSNRLCWAATRSVRLAPKSSRIPRAFSRIVPALQHADIQRTVR